MSFLFLFKFYQLVDAWRKFANDASKAIMLWNSRNNGYSKFIFLETKTDT